MLGLARRMLGVILATTLLLPTVAVMAQNQDSQITLGISPQLLDLAANPGQTLTSTFRLTNASEESIDITTTPKNFTPRGEEGAVDLTEDRTSFSIAEWVKVAPQSSTIAPKATKDFVVSIVVPDNVEPGSHFGSVVFQTVPPEQEGASALVSQEIAPVILVKIAGDVVETAEIEEFKSTKGFWSNEPAVSFLSRLKNTGTAHFKPTGKITIKNMFDREVTSLDLEKRNILPDSIRAFTTEWQQEGFKMGRYSAELTLVYGENNEIRTATASFIIFPWQTVVPIVVLTILVGIVVFRGRHRLLRAAKVLSGKDAGK